MEFATFRRRMALTERFEKTTAGLEGPREVAFGLLTPEVQHGGFGPVYHISDQLKSPTTLGGRYALEDTLEGHDSLDEQGLGVTHVKVQETHECDTL